MPRYAYTYQNVVDNMLCAVEMADPKLTKEQLLRLPGPTRQENRKAFDQLKESRAIFEEEGRYYISQIGLGHFLELTGGIRLSSGSEGSQRIERS